MEYKEKNNNFSSKGAPFIRNSFRSEIKMFLIFRSGQISVWLYWNNFKNILTFSEHVCFVESDYNKFNIFWNPKSIPILPMNYWSVLLNGGITQSHPEPSTTHLSQPEPARASESHPEPAISYLAQQRPHSAGQQVMQSAGQAQKQTRGSLPGPRAKGPGPHTTIDILCLVC